MWKDKPTGIKILWIWTIGTAAVLLTCVSRTRVRDMEKLMDQKQHHHQQQQQGLSSVDTVLVDSSLPSDDNDH
ncbi:hypothetical protein BVRB_4g075320 [Beta vulgaris subsp. vulgaris]|nr:hypothetical protein BVRB_4g075320 [Beta vulgaris subsp. vulgaris]